MKSRPRLLTTKLPRPQPTEVPPCNRRSDLRTSPVAFWLHRAHGKARDRDPPSALLESA
jgi:hypothetical protein